MRKTIIVSLVLFMNCLPQQVMINKFGLPVVNSVDLYEQTISSDSSKLLVDIEDYIDSLLFDIRYASDNNFYGAPVYSDKKAFLRKTAADSLLKIQRELLNQNKSLKIFDAYRPYNITVLFYEKIKDTNFVASAWTGSRHNRGCAVDVTIADVSTGKDLKMPTEYDEFTEKASIEYIYITDEERDNRELLQNLMKKYGFTPLKSEWWHFDFSGWQNYEITDINFNDLENVYLRYKEVK